MMKRVRRVLFLLLWLPALTGDPSRAQFTEFSEVSETRWGAAVFAGGDADSLGNYLFGLTTSYRILELDPLLRASPEVGAEFRKNYLLVKLGGRVDSREFERFSLFGGAGLLRIQDFTNASGDDYDLDTSDVTTYFYYGLKVRLPSMSGIPILAGVPISGVSLFAATEISGLTQPEWTRGAREYQIDEWYDTAYHFGVMIGSAGGWHGGD